MKRKMKLLVVVLITALAMTTSFNMIVRAEEPENSEEKGIDDEYILYGCGVVLSEDIVEGHWLQWESSFFFDTLTAVDDEKLHITYEYDKGGRRIRKTENGVTTSYVYDDDSYLLSQNCEGRIIEFVYDEGVYKAKTYKGFSYQNDYYEYVYEDGVIVGLCKDGVKVVQYIYNGCTPSGVYEIDESGNYIDRTSDSEFIGNINPIRYAKRYYENKLGWYYANGRYYSPAGQRYIDGISEEYAEELKGVYPDFELTAKTYTFGQILLNTSGRTLVPDTSDVVARVIYLESSQSSDDQLAVAWVIYNRMICNNSDFANANTAVAVVSQKNQFSTYGSSEFNNFDQYLGDPTNALYINAILLSGSLKRTTEQPDKPSFADTHSKPEGFDSQLNFYSARSFLEATVENGEIVKYPAGGGKIVYKDCWMVPVHSITANNFSNLQFDLLYSYMGKYNVFCTATYY